MAGRPPPPWAWLALAAGALATAWGGPLVILAEGAEPLVKAAWRTGLATLVLLPFSARLLLPAWRSLPGGARWLQFAAGAALALHFATWIASLEFTSVASSLVLVCTTPLWAALLSPRLAGDRVRRRELAGMGIALVGVVLIGAADFRVGGRAWFGDLLAVAGAMAAAVYLLLSRRLQRRLPALAFLSFCYGGAAFWLLLGCLLLGLPLAGFGGQTTTALVALALVPQLLGHSGYNLALRRLPAPTVTIVTLAEPVFGSLLAFLLFAERPGTQTLVGGAIILAGIAVAVTRRADSPLPS